MSARTLFFAVLAAVALAPLGECDEDAGLWWGSRRVELQDGLTSDRDGLWLSRRDLAKKLDVHAKRLIASSKERPKRRKRRRTDAWVLCYDGRCTRYEGETHGVTGSGTFNVSKIARGLGWRVRTREGGWLIEPLGRKGPPPRGRHGERVPAMRLRMLDGSLHDTESHLGRRLLIVVWSSWSPSRKRAGEFVALAKARKLDVLAVAVDLEGALRVRPYAPANADAQVALDYEGVVLQGLGVATVGRWILIDELGIHRASGELNDPGDWLWIDEHLAEPLAPAPPAYKDPMAGVGIDALREIVRRSPKDFGTKLALVKALGAEHRAEAAKLLRELIARQPRNMSLILRLAKLSMDASDRGEAVRILDAARRLNPARMPLRRQYWALEYPDRFYGGEIDQAWQKKQKKMEDEEWGRIKKR